MKQSRFMQKTRDCGAQGVRGCGGGSRFLPQQGISHIAFYIPR
jgi:hypothetical protein